MQGIKVRVTFVGARFDIALIMIMGYIDTTTCQELAKIIRDLMAKKRYQIIADLGGVTYISSAGWGVFVGEIKNIRDHGGDIKLVQMNSEVFEVFEMLEFNRILNHYDSIEETIDDFDMIRGLDITQGTLVKRKTKGKARPIPPYPIAAPLTSDYRDGSSNVSGKPIVPAKEFPLVEKIKMIIIENPFWGIKDICKQLKSEKYGSVHVSFLKMHSLLKKLNLETKEKRHRFYRSR